MMTSIGEKIKWLIEVNDKNSKKFIEDELSRQFYKAQHPTKILAFKCMDGRINLPAVTGTPLGIIEPYRNIGGRFNFGWPMLGEEIQKKINKNTKKGLKTLVLITYHYSKGDSHRGCAGFDYCIDDSVEFTKNLLKQFYRIFPKGNGVAFPIIIGLETDTDSLIFHGEDFDNVLSVDDSLNSEEGNLISLLNKIYPSMDNGIKKDIVPLIEGNIEHIKKVKGSNRNLDDMKHKEWVLGIGRGFDWLHEPNTALLIGPFNPEFSAPITKAIGLILGNMEEGRINNDGFLVLSSAIFKKEGFDKARAIEKTNFFCKTVKNVIETNHNDILPKVQFMRVVVNKKTRKIEQVPEIDSGL